MIDRPEDLALKLTREEKSRILLAAKSSGMTMSAYVRMRLLAGSNKEETECTSTDSSQE